MNPGRKKCDLRSAILSEQVAADSSGLTMMSSPSSSSDSGSLKMDPERSYTTFGKDMKRMSMLNEHESNDFKSSGPKRSSQIGNLTHAGANTHTVANKSRSTTDFFLTQFQAQISQMKSAMDAVQNELLSGKDPASQGTSEVPTGVSGTTRKRVGKSNEPGPSDVVSPTGTELQQKIRYQSQISTSNGLKMKICKSPSHGKKGPVVPNKRVRKYKSRKKKSDDEISDEDENEAPVVKKSGNNSKSASKESVVSDLTPSGWGDLIPESILFRIFSFAVDSEGSVPFLTRVAKVSRLWWTVSKNPKLWTNVDMTNSKVKDKYKTERNLVYLAENRFTNVKHLNLGGWSSAVASNAVDAIARCCKNIESLGLSSCQKLTAPNLKTVTDSCTKLKKLDLSAVSTTYNAKGAVSPTSFGEAAETMGENLVHLSLAYNCLTNAHQIFSSLAEHCHQLEVLDFSNMTSPRRDAILIKIEQLQEGCPKLRVLRLANSEFVLGEVSIKDQVSSPGFPCLEELSIAVDPKKFPGMDNSDLERIVKNSKKLKLLDVRGCTKINDSGLVRIPAWDLEHLYLSGCFATRSSDDGLELIVRKWKHSFREIDFSWTTSEKAINLALKALAEKDSGSQLTILDLCGSSVTFESVKMVLTTCMHICRLNLTSCRALPRGIKRNYQTVDEVSNLRQQIMDGKFDDNNQD